MSEKQLSINTEEKMLSYTVAWQIEQVHEMQTALQVSVGFKERRAHIALPNVPYIQVKPLVVM